MLVSHLYNSIGLYDKRMASQFSISNSKLRVHGHSMNIAKYSVILLHSCFILRLSRQNLHFSFDKVGERDMLVLSGSLTIKTNKHTET